MGPIGYPAPTPPAFASQDEPWPPPHWTDQAAPAPPPGPPGGAAAPDEPFPPPHWQVGDPTAQLSGPIQPTQPLPEEEPNTGVLEQQHQELGPPGAPMGAPAGKNGRPLSKNGAPMGKNGPAAPGMNPFVAGIEAGADARSQAVDQDAAAKQAEADFRSQRAQGAYMSQQLAMRQADDDYAAAKKAGQEKAQALAKEVDDFGKSKIDPNRAFANQSTGQKLLMIGALFAGGMQSAFTGRNLALEAVNRVLDRDFEQQKEDLATRKDALATKRSLLSEELANGKDEYEARVKHALIGYDMAMKGIDAEAAKFQSPQIQAAAQEKKAEIQGAALDKLQELQRYGEEKSFRQQQADRQNSLGWYNAKTGRMGEEANAQARKDALEAKTAGKQFPIRGNDGSIVGYAASDKEQEDARQTVVAKGKLDKLYQRGRELFSEGWAAPGTERRARQDAWNQDWAMARRHASGDHSAPNKDDQKNWGLDTSRTITNKNMDVLDEAYNIAVDNGAATLKASGIGDDTLKAQGYIRPPAPPTPGYTEHLDLGPNGEVLPTGEIEARKAARARQDAQIRDGRLPPEANGTPEQQKAREMDRLYGTHTADQEMAPTPTEQGQNMPAGVEAQDWSVVEPKYWPQWYRDKVAREKRQKGKR